MAKTVEAGETFTVDEDKRLGTPVTVEGDLVVEQTLTVDPVIDSQAQAVDTDSGTVAFELIRELTATSSDSDSSNSSLERIRELFAGFSNELKVEKNDTVTIDTPTEFTTTVVEGELTVESELTLGSLFDSQDTDASTPTLERVRDLSSTAADGDTSTTTTTRERDLATESVDVDSASAPTTRVRALVASASDTDASLAVLIPRSGETDPRALAIDIMEQTYNWPNDKPDVFRSEEIPQKAKQNNSDPAIYVHKPSSGEIERFSADGIDMTEDESVELHVWILDTTNPERSARDYRNERVNTFA